MHGGMVSITGLHCLAHQCSIVRPTLLTRPMCKHIHATKALLEPKVHLSKVRSVRASHMHEWGLGWC